MENVTERVLKSTAMGSILGNLRSGCLEFLGVPYARAERFEYARRVDSWEGELDATRPGPSCPQNRAVHEHLENPTRLFYKREYREGIDFTYSEDCLNLNIFTPERAKNCPVIIFFHGGGFDSGMNCEGPFDGAGLARRGIVTVFANYRVGVLGYLTHEDIQAKYGRDGNFGLDDMLTAIRWVKEHIADFGGDGENITLMGQSAGAISIQYLCLSKDNAGLFRRAIMMSGAGLFPKFALPKPAADTRSYWLNFMELAGCRTLEELKRVPTGTLFDAVEKIKALRRDNAYNTMPVVDGALISAPVDELIRTPLPIDYMIGYTNADMFAPVLAFIGNRFGKAAGAYIYYFDLDAPGDKNGAFHSSDLRYAFETLSGSWRPYSGRDYEAAGELADYMANFSRCGDPNSAGLPRWEKGAPALCFGPKGTAMGRPDYLKLTVNMLTKGDPKA